MKQRTNRAFVAAEKDKISEILNAEIDRDECWEEASPAARSEYLSWILEGSGPNFVSDHEQVFIKILDIYICMIDAYVDDITGERQNVWIAHLDKKHNNWRFYVDQHVRIANAFAYKNFKKQTKEKSGHIYNMLKNHQKDCLPDDELYFNSLYPGWKEI